MLAKQHSRFDGAHLIPALLEANTRIEHEANRGYLVKQSLKLYTNVTMHRVFLELLWPLL